MLAVLQRASTVDGERGGYGHYCQLNWHC